MVTPVVQTPFCSTTPQKLDRFGLQEHEEASKGQLRRAQTTTRGLRQRTAERHGGTYRDGKRLYQHNGARNGSRLHEQCRVGQTRLCGVQTCAGIVATSQQLRRVNHVLHRLSTVDPYMVVSAALKSGVAKIATKQRNPNSNYLPKYYQSTKDIAG